MVVMRSPLGGLIGLVITLVIVFFVIKPALDDANDISNIAIQQSQDALDQAKQQTPNAGNAQKQIEEAQKLLEQAQQ